MLRFLRIVFGYLFGAIALAVGFYAFTQDMAGVGAIVLVLGALLIAIGYFS